MSWASTREDEGRRVVSDRVLVLREDVFHHIDCEQLLFETNHSTKEILKVTKVLTYMYNT